jgi:hypothetical protein
MASVMDKIFTYSESQLIKLCNEVREIIVHDLQKHEFITPEKRDLYLKTRVLIGYKPNWFGKLWSILNGKKTINECDEFLIVPITMEDPSYKEPPDSTKKDIKGNIVSIFPKK